MATRTLSGRYDGLPSAASAPGIWQEVRDLGITVPALNEPDLPLQITRNGQEVFVTEATFSYRGPATNLRIGVAWRPPRTPLRLSIPFDDGAHIIGRPHSGWGFSPFLSVDASPDFVAHRFVFRFDLQAPALGDNLSRTGDLVVVPSNEELDTWVWLWDPGVTGSVFAPGADETYLVADTDSKVIRMHGAIPNRAGRNLEVRYEL